MSNRVLLFAAAAFMAASSAGFASTAIAAPRATGIAGQSIAGLCRNAGFEPGDLQFTDCIKTLRQETRPDTLSSPLAAYSGAPNASRFMAYAGPRSRDAEAPHDFYTSDHRSAEVRACRGAGLTSQALRQCVGNLDAARWQEDISGHG